MSFGQRYIKRIFLGILLPVCFQPAMEIMADEFGNVPVSYVREIGNELHLSDFQLGSEETIKDEDGHGMSIGRIVANRGYSFILLSAGLTTTRYSGVVEDGVEFSFEPTSGSGFEVLSSSNNIFYHVDLQFSNPFVAFSYTNWEITKASVTHWTGSVFLPSTYGFGLIFQKAEGEIVIKGIDDTLIATASYRSATQLFGMLGWTLQFDFAYASLSLRYVTSPELSIDYCNEEAVGEDACDRIEAATGNRNQANMPFTGGVFEVGILF